MFNDKRDVAIDSDIRDVAGSTFELLCNETGFGYILFSNAVISSLVDL